MPRVVPSQIVEAINSMFPKYNELDAGVAHQFQSNVRALLALLDQLPADLIDLPFQDYVEFEQCRAALATALPAWSLGGIQPTYSVKGKNAVESIRRFMMKCHDELPPLESEFLFVTETSAAVALEASLLFEVKRLAELPHEGSGKTRRKKAPDEMVLDDLINAVEAEGSISEIAAKQAHLARDARNLIHPGKVARSGISCNKSSALAALAAIYKVAEELNRGVSKRVLT